MIVVIIPTSISMGARRVLARISALIVKVAPKKDDRTKIVRKCGLAMIRAMCGATRPMNGNAPPQLMAEPTRMDIRMRAYLYWRMTLTPNVLAASSPKVIMSIVGASRHAIKTQMK